MKKQWTISRDDMDSYTTDEDGKMAHVVYIYPPDNDPRIAVFGSDPRERAKAIVRAVNTFDQARAALKDFYEFFTSNHENAGLEVYGRVNGRELTPTARRLNELLDEVKQALAAMEAQS